MIRVEELEGREMLSPVVLGVVVNPLAQSAQASSVVELEVDFNEPVTLSPGAITISLHQNVTINGVAGQTVGVVPTLTETQDGPQDYFINFSGAGVIANSIANGVYDLTVHGALVQGADGSGNSDFVATFFRMFGDTNTNGENLATVDMGDYETFLTTFGSHVGFTGPAAPPYLWYLDANGDGRVNITDYSAFVNDYNQTWSWQNIGPQISGSVAGVSEPLWSGEHAHSGLMTGFQVAALPIELRHEMPMRV